MSNNLIHKSSVVQAQLRHDIPFFTTGSVISVHYKIKEGVKERIQIFTGIVIDRHEKKSLNATFKVLKVATGSIKTVRTFPLHSPNILKVIVTNLQRGRRSNLRDLLDVKDPIKAIRGKKIANRVISAPTSSLETVAVPEHVAVAAE